MSGWANKLKEVREHEHDGKAAMVAANDNYAGFVPETLIMFREILGLNLYEWGLKRNISKA
jgi:hypothetical protein